MINIVLYQPEIPQNTGNIMRTCVAFGLTLHLIKPLGFELDEKRVKRAGMDYIKDLKYYMYDNWSDFYNSHQDGQYMYMTRYASKHFGAFKVKEDAKNYYLVFGKESTGIDKHILIKHLDDCFRIPMIENARSLNLSNCVALCSYEVLRQLNFLNLSQKETIKGADFLERFIPNE